MKKLLLISAIVFYLNTIAQNINTIAGNGTQTYAGDGAAATSAALNSPSGVFEDGSGNFYIADMDNNRIRKVDGSTGLITTIAGNGIAGFSGDGAAATSAKLNKPIGVFVDGSGNLFIADSDNNRIRKVNNSTGIITTVAGNGTGGYAGDGLVAINAELNGPVGIFVDSSSNIFIADFFNHRIRKVNGSTSIITTIAGNGTGGYAGDAAAAINAELFYPEGVFVDGSNNLFIADTYNHRVRKVNGSTGIITTIAGNGTGGYAGDGAAAASAELYYPYGIFVDASGNIFIADYANNRIREINGSTSVITTIAGNGTGGFSGDGALATIAELKGPIGVFVDGSGNLLIADQLNNRIRKVDSGTTGINDLTNVQTISIYPNPTSEQFFIDANTTNKLTLDLYDVNGRHVFSKNASNKSHIDVTNLIGGVYSMTIKTADRLINKKLVIVR